MRLCFLHFYVDTNQIGSLSSHVFERSTSIGSGLFSHLSRCFERFFGQIVSKRVKTVTELAIQIWWRQGRLREKKSSPPVDVHRSKTLLLKLSSITPNTLLHFGNGSYNLSHTVSTVNIFDFERRGWSM